MRLVIICAAALAGCDAVAVGVRATPLGCRSAMRLVRVRACDTPAEEELPADAPPVVDDGDDVAADGADGLLSSPAFMKKKIEVLEDEISKLQLENANLEAKLEEETRTPQALRLQADFENFRRRTVEQQAEQRVLSTIENVKKLLPVLDNFDRAAALKLGSEEATKIQGSYTQLYKQLLDVLAKDFGCTEIEAAGQPFDFNLHMAIVSAPSATVPEGHVADVLQRGYMIGDKLVRPAGVRVSTGAPPSEAPAA